MPTSKTTALVAGAGGFIGGHLVGELLARGYAVRSVDVKAESDWFQCFPAAENLRLDLREREAAKVACEGVDEVFNLACDMGGMGFIEANRARCMISVLINTHLLMAAREAAVRRYFYASSACAYNVDLQQANDGRGLREEDAYPAKPEAGYGWEKLFSERMCADFRRDFGLETRVARFHNVYGPHGSFRGGREKAPAAICRKVAQAVLTGEQSIDIWGDGEQSRSFAWIDDCVDGVLRIQAGDHRDPINLGSSELVTINQLVSIVEDIAGIQLARHYQLDAPKGVRGRNSDNTRIREVFGWEPSTSLRAGLEQTYAWIFDRLSADVPGPLPTEVPRPWQTSSSSTSTTGLTSRVPDSI